MNQILHIKAPSLPEFIFEWHPQTRKVYSIRQGTVPTVGEVLALEVLDHGSAINAVNIWIRGYQAARSSVPLLHLAEG